MIKERYKTIEGRKECLKKIAALYADTNSTCVSVCFQGAHIQIDRNGRE